MALAHNVCRMLNELFQKNPCLCVWFLSGQPKHSAAFPLKRLQKARVGEPLSTVRIITIPSY